MFDTLLETGARRERSWSSYIASITLHGALIGAAVAATHEVVEASAEPARETIVFLREAEPQPAPVVVPPNAVVAPPAPKGFQVVVAPVNIPDVLPAIDLTRAVTNAADFVGRGVPGGTADGVVGAPPRPVVADGAYSAAQVDKPAMLMAGSTTPEYPDLLKSAGVEGMVRVTFVIDRDGRPEPGTLRIVESSHALFADAVRRALPHMRFLPAEVAGRPVRQLVEMPFAFSIK
jgi:protein TonB